MSISVRVIVEVVVVVVVVVVGVYSVVGLEEDGADGKSMVTVWPSVARNVVDK